MDLEKIVNDLESNKTAECEESKRKLGEYITQTKDSWLVSYMMDYFYNTGSLRIGEVLVKVQAPHDTHIFDRLTEWLKVQTHRLPAINFFSFVVRRHPTWLYKVEKHRLIKDIFKLLQTEKDIVLLMSALLCVITLLPIIPNSVPNFLDDLYAVFGHLASWNFENSIRLSGEKLVHLQLGLQMLFQRLYGMYPNNFLNFLIDFIKRDQKGAIYQHTIKPLLATVRVHPLLLIATSASETSSTRWKEMEPHDVVVECASVTLPVLHQDFNLEAAQIPAIYEFSVPETPILTLPSTVPQLVHGVQTFTQQTINHTTSWLSTPLDPDKKYPLMKKNTVEISRSETKRQRSWEENNLSNKIAIWSPYDELITNANPIPLTPNFMPMVTPNPNTVTNQLLGLTGSSPPEAAVEATPETTPMKDITKELKQPPIGTIISGQASGINNPSAVRAIFVTSQPSSPMRKDPNLFNFPETIIGNFINETTTTSNAAYFDKELTNQQRPQQQRFITHPERGFGRLQSIDQTSIDQSIEAEAMAATRRENLTPIEANSKSETPDIDSDVLTNRLEYLNSARTHTHTPTQQIQTPIPLEKACLECNETDHTRCSAGGLQMPTRYAMNMMLTGIKRRNRMLSCSYTECEKNGDFKMKAENDIINEKAKVRRTKSCSSIFLANLTESSPSKDEKSTNLQISQQQSSCRLQKSGKMLSIAASASKATKVTVSNIIERSHAACQTIESAVTLNYESSLFKMLTELRELNRQYESKLMNPQQLLDQFIMSSLMSNSTFDNNYRPDQEQFQLLGLQLQYERYRREIHAERNRRLMGRNRTKQSLEMERDRLREQLNSFALNNEKLMEQNDATIKAANEREQRLNEEITALKSCLRSEVEKNNVLKEENEHLQARLNEQSTSRKDINYEIEALRGQIFNLNTELQQAQLQIDIGNQYKQELARLEAEIIIMGEIQVKCRDQIMEIDNLKAREEEMQKFREAYNIELRDTKFKLEEKTSQLDSSKHKIIELQLQLVNHEKTITEQKRLLRTVKEEYEERFKALAKKYENQKVIIMQMEEKIASLHRPYTTGGQTSSPDGDKTDAASSMERNSPLSTSLASSESLSTSLRSTELRNLQQLAEANSGSSNAIVAQDIERLPTTVDFDGPSTSAATTAFNQKR